MKKWSRVFLLSAVCVVILYNVFLWSLERYYDNHFPVNTWINGIYCTGKTVEEVNDELKQNNKASVILIADANTAYWEMELESIELYPDYRDSLQNLLDENSKASGMDKLRGKTDIQLVPDCYAFNRSTLRKCLEETEFVKAEVSESYGVEIRYNENGYFLYDGNEKRLNVDILYQTLVEAFGKGECKVTLDEQKLYQTVPDNEADFAMRNLWEWLEVYSDCKLIYDMGDELIEITPELAISFLEQERSRITSGEDSGAECWLVSFSRDTEGNLLLDEAAVNGWVEELVQRYNTCGTIKEFVSTRGDVVKVPYVNYGTELDSSAEKEYLLQALTTVRTETEVHVPTYVQQGFVRGVNDIGGTYIEIDMTNQKMYYYKDFEVLLETDVVTGDVRDDMETPEGINYVYNKQRNRTLRGPGYATFVKYWMPVIGGVGIHDASWRSKFGGEIYVKNGSHGCINTPSSIMDDFYEVVEIGTPVIMFY